MPQKRHIDERRILVRSLGLGMPAGSAIPPHAHRWHQLVYATGGVMTVETPVGTWVVPSHRAVWIPAGFEHTIRMSGAVRMRTLYFRPDLPGTPERSCCAINVSPLLRELILETLRCEMLMQDVPAEVHMSRVLLDQLVQTHVPALETRLPSDRRARKVADRAQADLSATRSLAELARGCGASARTIERLFVRQTGVTFGRWLQRVKALHALERLATGDSVTSAALSVGYDSTSAFIAMFKRNLGTTPGNYFSAAQKTARDP